MATPFRVCDLAGEWHTVDLAPDASEAGAREAIAAVVRLALVRVAEECAPPR